MLLVIALSFIIFLFIGVPIPFVLGLSSVVFILFNDLTLTLVPQRIFVSLDSFIMIAVPCYMLTGNLMTHGGLTKRMVKFLLLVVGHIRGALAIANVLASVVFAGIQGSATGDTAAIGGIFIPVMKDADYTPAVSAAVTASSSTIGPIIPPSILLVVYSVSANVSIGALFLAGIIPGLLSGLALAILCVYLGKKQNWPKNPTRAGLRELLGSLGDCILALIAPFIIILGIITGFATPTETAVIAVIYSFICGIFIFKEIKLRDIPEILLETAILNGGVIIIVGMSGIFSWVLTYIQIPRIVSAAMLGITRNPMLILLMINIILLFVGTFMEATSAILIFTPILLPIAKSLGMDPIHFGIVVVFNLALGVITPPVGTCLYIAAGIAKIKFEELAIAIIPYLLTLLFMLAILVLFPALSTTLPRILLNWR